MIRKYTLKEFLANPFGKGSSAISTKTNRGEYIARYNQLVSKGKLCYLHQICEDKDRWLLHVMVASENVEKEIYYDVVVEFYPLDSSFKQTNYLTNYGVRFYSNCPSFTYTFLNVYDKYGILIPEFKNKVPNKYLENDPSTRNPFGIINYDKSIFFAAHYILTSNNNRLIQKDYLHKALKGAKSLKGFVDDVNNPDEKMTQIKAEDRRIKELLGTNNQNNKNKINEIENRVKQDIVRDKREKETKIIKAKQKITAKKSSVKTVKKANTVKIKKKK